MELVLTWRELLIAVALASAVYLFESLILARRRNNAGSPRRDQEEVARLRAEVAELRDRLLALESTLGVVEPVEIDTAHAAYDYAVQYARQGMIAPEIAARCGISRDEAALIVAMHRKSLET